MNRGVEGSNVQARVDRRFPVSYGRVEVLWTGIDMRGCRLRMPRDTQGVLIRGGAGGK